MFFRVVHSYCSFSSSLILALFLSCFFQSHACTVGVLSACRGPRVSFVRLLLLAFLASRCFPSGISEFGLYFQAGTYISKPRLGCASIFPPLPSYVLADAVSMCSVDVVLYSLLDYFVIHMYIFLLSFNSCMRIGSDLHVHLRYGNF